MVTSTSSVVEITYRAPVVFEGIELMGVDAGLSWLKGQSISMKKQRTEEEIVDYVGYIEVRESCEFRARGYDQEGDRWEAGLANHRIERKEDATITFTTELDGDLYAFKGSLPTDFSPSLEEAIFRLTHLDRTDPSLFQTLIDLSLWIAQVEANPLSEDYIYPIAGIIRHLKVKSRELESLKVDNVVRPVLKSLFMISRTALEFSEEDVRLLTGTWESQNYIEPIRQLPDAVKPLENDLGLGTGTDGGDRFKELLKFAS